VLIPKENGKDVMSETKFYDMIEIITVENLRDVLEQALVDCEKKEQYLKKLLPLTECGSSTAKCLEKPIIADIQTPVRDASPQ
ncbi:MAG: hypothetical protein FWD81_05185, partial [Methanomassiliicoccaceae archaeon]|nr:hypothetical protein [Methanomassiliicoccaceae archaeon]